MYYVFDKGLTGFYYFRLTSIRSVANRAREARKSESAPSNAWEENDTFLVCIYNVSPEIPYAILKVKTSINITEHGY